MDHQAIASELYFARLAGQLCSPPSDTQPLKLDDAYLIQDAVLEYRFARGERLVGYKIGYASQVMREQMGINEPNFGPLTDAMILENDATIGAGLLQPRAEPEVLIELVADLGSNPSRDEVENAVGRSRAAIEIVDSVFANFRFTLEDNTADGSSAAKVVVGPVLPEAIDLSLVEVELFVDDGRVGKATGAAAMGHPLEAVRWLAAAVAARGTPLRAGQIVLTGGLTAAFPLEIGGKVRAQFSGAWDVLIGRDR